MVGNGNMYRSNGCFRKIGLMKRIFGYKLVGKTMVKLPDLVDYIQGLGDVIVSSYWRRCLVADDGSLRRDVA